MMGYNENYEDYVMPNTTYDTYYIKYNEYDRAAYEWGAYIREDQMVIIAVPQNPDGSQSPAGLALEGILVAALGTVTVNNTCLTTTSTTTAAPASTTTTTTLFP